MNVPAGIDADKVSQWFERKVAGVETPLEFSPIVGGHSNLTFLVTDARDRRFVLRRPPLGAVLKTAHDMGREHRILRSLFGTAVPVPPTLGYCEDEAVNGAPFYVMDFVDGAVLDSPEMADRAIPSTAARRELSRQVVDILAALHQVEPQAVGLGDLGKHDGYLDRQLRRWSIQWERAKTRELAAMEETHRLLVAARPEQRYTGICHGDYRLGNMLTTASGEVAAVLDWELCTLGDTLADLGYLLNSWTEPEDLAPRGSALGATAASGFATREELIARYVDRTGHEVEGIDYYCGFQMWRLAAICEGVYARYKKGVMGDQDYDETVLRLRVELLAQGALSLVRGSG